MVIYIEHCSCIIEYAEEMDMTNQKKAVTIDKKPVDVGKKGDKKIADVKPKPHLEKPATTKPATQPSSAAATETSQVTALIDIHNSITVTALHCVP